MSVSVRSSTFRSVTFGSVAPAPANLFLDDDFEGSAGTIAGRTPTSGYPDPAYGFNTWTVLAGSPVLSGTGELLLDPGDGAQIQTSGSVTYNSQAGGYVVSVIVDSTVGKNAALTVEGVLPNGILYSIFISYDSYVGGDPQSSIYVSYGPSEEFFMEALSLVDMGPSVAVYFGTSAQSITVNDVEVAAETETLTFNSGNTASLSLYASTNGATDTLAVGNVQIDTL